MNISIYSLKFKINLKAIDFLIVNFSAHDSQIILLFFI